MSLHIQEIKQLKKENTLLHREETINETQTWYHAELTHVPLNDRKA